jgi:hypothetical protein
MGKRLVGYRSSFIEATVRMIGLLEESPLDEKWKRTSPAIP